MLILIMKNKLFKMNYPKKTLYDDFTKTGVQ